MPHARRTLAAAVTLTMLAACTADPPAAAPASAPPSEAQQGSGTPGADGDAALVGQVLMPYAYGNHATEVDDASKQANQRLAGVDTPAEMVSKYQVGGVILVSFAAEDPTGKTNPGTNVEKPEQVRALTDGLRAAAGRPLLIGTDQEYGVVTRVRDGVTMLPSAMAFGAAGKPELTERAWATAGRELSAMGINVDFAPVADTLGPDGSKVLGSRAFGADPAANAQQVAAAVRGLRSAGVAATLKHFPGHGHTSGDSHDELPVVAQSKAEWTANDRPPFEAGIKAGAELVMSGHLDVAAFDPGRAATFSSKVMTGALRDDLKFTGVAVTDAMNMAPAMKLPPGEAAVQALLAGNDLVLMPPNVTAARDGLLAALKDGRLPRARLQQAADRVRKLQTSLAPPGRPAASNPADVRAAAAAAITVLRGSCKRADRALTVTAAKGREAARANLVEALAKAGVGSGGPVVHLTGYGDKPADLSPQAAVTVIMDKPANLPPRGDIVLTYSSSPLSMSALADFLAGKAGAPGRSPVDVPGLPRSACR